MENFIDVHELDGDYYVYIDNNLAEIFETKKQLEEYLETIEPTYQINII